MFNVDGVIMGNFRAGLLGKDLNRCFDEEEITMYQEVKIIVELASDLKKIFN